MEMTFQEGSSHARVFTVDVKLVREVRSIQDGDNLHRDLVGQAPASVRYVVNEIQLNQLQSDEDRTQ